MFGFEFKITHCLSSALNIRQHSFHKRTFEIIIFFSSQLWKIKKHIPDQLPDRIKRVYLLNRLNILILGERRYQNIPLIHEWVESTVSVCQWAARSSSSKHFRSLCQIFYYCKWGKTRKGPGHNITFNHLKNSHSCV